MSKAKEVADALKDTLSFDKDYEHAKKNFEVLLGLPDEQFVIIAPDVLQSLEQSCNNSNERLLLTQGLNAIGKTADDINELFVGIMSEIDDKSDISVYKRDFIKRMLGIFLTVVNETEGIAKRNLAVAIELCHPDAKIPEYAHLTDAGADIFAVEDTVIHPGETKLVPTGLKIACPVGYEMQVRMKSGRAVKTKMRLANAIATIDSGFRDQVMLIIENVEPPIKDITIDDEGRVTSIEYGKDYEINKGEKICQFILSEVPKAVFYKVDDILEAGGENRGGGFGSSSLYAKDDERYRTDLK